jgi:hypothetical protein
MLRRPFTKRAQTSFETKLQSLPGRTEENAKPLRIAGNWFEIRTGGLSEYKAGVKLLGCTR